MKATGRGGGNRRRTARGCGRGRGRGARFLVRRARRGRSAGRSAGRSWSTGSSGRSAGLGAGIVAAILGTDGFGLALAGVGAALGFVVGPLPHHPRRLPRAAAAGTLTPVVQLAALLAHGRAGDRWCGALLRGADARRRALTRPGVAAALVAIAGAALGWRQPSAWRGRRQRRRAGTRGGAARGRAERDPRHGRHAARRSSRRLRLRGGQDAAASTRWRPTACAARTRSRRRRGRARRWRRS